jgi:outer membrane protein OmpA-like peptidoglycan-associated protein
MAQLGVAGEMYVVQRWGLSVIGEVYGYPSLTSFPDSPKQVPAEALLGLRWQTKHGITITFGGSFGAACGFGSPAIRFFNGITWQPKSSREQEEINRLLMGDSYDPDHDGIAGEADRCPDKPGSPERLGCPDRDIDDDGIFDRDDECPFDSAGGRGKNGCPPAYIKDKEIVVLDPIHFAPGKDIILDESKPILDEIARVLKDNQDVRELVIEGHTDSRAGTLYNINLSQRRVNSIMAELVRRGVDPARMTAEGSGQSELEYDDSTCTMPDEELTPDCRFMASKNQRIVFRIKRFGLPPPRSLTGAPGESSLPLKKNILPWAGDGVLPSIFRKVPGKESKPNPYGTLPNGGVLEKKKDAVLGSGSVLPPSSTKDPAGGEGLKKDGVLPKSQGVLPNSGTPEAAPPTTPTTPPKVTAPDSVPKAAPRRPRRPRRHQRGSNR